MNPKITLSYIVWLFVAVFLSCFFHELAHWLAGTVLGNPMTMSMNTVKTVAESYTADWHANVVTAAGPLFTMLQAIVFYFVIRKAQHIKWYPFLFFPFVYQFFAGLANYFEPNDEGRLSLDYGMGLYTLSVIVSIFLLVLILQTSRKFKLGFKINIVSFLLSAVFLFVIVLADQFLKIQII